VEPEALLEGADHVLEVLEGAEAREAEHARGEVDAGGGRHELEVHELAAARFQNLYVLPVSAALVPHAEPEAMPPRPNRHVFVSLGGDDELDLLSQIVRRRPDLHFFVPDQSWRKSDTATREPSTCTSPGRTSPPCPATRGVSRTSRRPTGRPARRATRS
jgi:hypothetical protein